MKRVAIIGSSGAGKSTFSVKLSKILGIQVIHLDLEYWKPGWIETPENIWKDKMKTFLQGDNWIIDGNYGASMDRLQAADTIIFLDISKWICLYSVLKRRITYHNKTRPDMGQDCQEKVDLKFLKWIYHYPNKSRPDIHRKLSILKSDKKIYVLKSRMEMERFLEEIKRDK